MYYIYWIHTANHQNPYEEGYIGLSNQPEKRFKAHTTDTAKVGSKRVSEYVEEHGTNSLIHTLLHSVTTLIEAQQLEQSYRPNSNIGWNMRKGGGITPDCSGREHTQETKDKISKTNLKTKSKRVYTSKFKGVTGRWTKEQKARIGAFHKGRPITEKHKRAIAEKNSGKDNPKSVSIRILDTVTNTEYTFESLRQAAIELNIPYPTVRSASNKGQKLIHKRWEIIRGGE